MEKEQKSALTLVPPVGWELLDSSANECVLCTKNGVHMITARIRLVPYSDSEDVLHDIFYRRIKSIATVIDFRSYSFLYDNIKWIVDSYVCEGVEERYHSLYYALLDHCYLVIELLTASNQSVLCFTGEAKRLMHAVDYSVINRTNRVKVGDEVFRLQTPSTFRFSRYSTDKTLLFLGENGYLLVNTCEGADSLEDFVKRSIDATNDGLDVRIEITASQMSDNWESLNYQIVEHKLDYDLVTGTAVYFKQVIDGVDIVSFLYENGASLSINPKGWLEFEKEE